MEKLAIMIHLITDRRVALEFHLKKALSVLRQYGKVKFILGCIFIKINNCHLSFLQRVQL